MNFFKKLLIPSGETEVTALETWTVRWHSRHGSYGSDTRPECEVFLNEEDAKKFADALKAAYKLIKHTSGTSVTVEKTK